MSTSPTTSLRSRCRARAASDLRNAASRPVLSPWRTGLCLLSVWVAGAASSALALTPPPPPPPLAGPAPLDVFGDATEQLGVRRMFLDAAQREVDAISARRKAELAALKTPEDWKAMQAKTRQRLTHIFGEFPKRTPLNPRSVGRLERATYTLEKVIFESQPGYFITANLYIPKGRKFPLPGIVFPCGHSDLGKGYDAYQLSGSGFADKGYVVLVFDPIGQGERSEHWDPATQKHRLGRGVIQHHYMRQPGLLVDWTLPGLRLWDGIRAVDYLESRPEVDKQKLAAVGCSGGGQMAWYVTAVDERIKVCALSHPGGSCEDSNLRGVGEEGPFKYEVQSLVAPRPMRIIGGIDSGQVPVYRKSFEDVKLFYAGLKADMSRCELEVVPGIHSMDQNNREAAYEWLNKWFDKTAEGKPEGAVKPEKLEDTWCTPSGNTIASLGGETGQTLNARRADAMVRPGNDPGEWIKRINHRVGLTPPRERATPPSRSFGAMKFPGVTVEKFTYESEKGVVVPALLLTPERPGGTGPIYVFASDQGKPRSHSASLPFLLAQAGAVVLAIDVRGTGETGPPVAAAGVSPGVAARLGRDYELAALQVQGAGHTVVGLRTLDLLRGIDFVQARQKSGPRKLVLVGEGSVGLCALLAALNDARVSGVATVGTLPSYKMLTHERQYEVQGYFTVPGALRDFDIVDLARLSSAKPQLWVAPVNGLGRELDRAAAASLLGGVANLQLASGAAPTEIVRQFTARFN